MDANGSYHKQSIPIPTVVTTYNAGMGGTDSFDQRMSYYKTIVRTRKWMQIIIFISYKQWLWTLIFYTKLKITLLVLIPFSDWKILLKFSRNNFVNKVLTTNYKKILLITIHLKSLNQILNSVCMYHNYYPTRWRTQKMK